MSEYRPLEVVAAMAALGVSKAHRDAFYEAAEDYTTMTSKQLNEAMRVAGLAVDERVAVKQRLEGGSPAPTPPATPGAAITAPPASHHHEARRHYELVFWSVSHAPPVYVCACACMRVFPAPLDSVR